MDDLIQNITGSQDINYIKTEYVKLTREYLDMAAELKQQMIENNRIQSELASRSAECTMLKHHIIGAKELLEMTIG